MKLIIMTLIAGVLMLGTPEIAEAKGKAEAKTTQQVMQPVNINIATAEQLSKALKGVGIKKAKAIVALREKLGKFKAAEQLMDVKGIGKTTFEKNKALIKL